jgi:hypothetical protein
MSGTYSRLIGQRLEPSKAANEVSEPITSIAPKVDSAEEAVTPISKRVVKRVSHDLYTDQMKTLSTKTRAFFLMKGVNKSVTQMIREAIDEYITKNQ